MKIKQINIKKKMSVSQIMEEYANSGVLGAGKVAKASALLANMINDKNMKIFLSVAGPLVPGGLRNIIANMIKNKQVDLLITSGANITHDLLESFGGRHYRGLGFNDEKLNKEGVGRIGDLYTKSEDFEVFEKETIAILDKISEKIANKKDYASGTISIKNLLYEIGNMLKDENSILKIASENNIPIFAPGLIDSMLGLQLWMFTQDRELKIDAVEDMHDLSEIVFDSKHVGAIFLGGGLPKHYTLASNLLKGGIDAGIQITMDRPETGSLSGATLEEAKSWSKAKSSSKLVSVVGDVTILFPLILAGALDNINEK
ncbi:MAG: deoxyhypusine synthase [Methanobacteriaceae archaeon]|jgi:deoxyhypusine synthase|nr:deoxyhypusine synthase [Candidatus Methanorudis spinitermitis]